MSPGFTSKALHVLCEKPVTGEGTGRTKPARNGGRRLKTPGNHVDKARSASEEGTKFVEEERLMAQHHPCASFRLLRAEQNRLLPQTVSHARGPTPETAASCAPRRCSTKTPEGAPRGEDYLVNFSWVEIWVCGIYRNGLVCDLSVYWTLPAVKLAPRERCGPQRQGRR